MFDPDPKGEPMRIILFAGKGGVGKTSMAAATGLRSAVLGHKTLVMSLDSAHSLADIFDVERSLHDRAEGKPIRVASNLWYQELDVQEEIHRHWGDVYKYIATLFYTSGLEEVIAEELAVLPGMEEVSGLLYVNQYLNEMSYDVVLLDCAPTGESLRFISMPTTLEWYMNKVFAAERRMFKIVRPLLKSVSNVPLPEDSYFASLEALYDKLQGADAVLQDPDMTSVRLVTNPEKVVLKETQRAFMYFALYGLCIDAVIINRILGEQATGEHWSRWRSTHSRYIKEAEEAFAPVPRLHVNLFKDEIVGAKELERLGEALYGETDPTEVFFSEAPFTFKKVRDTYLMTVALPFLTKEEVDLTMAGSEVIIRIANFKRHIPLPKMARAMEPVGASVDGRTLTITFKRLRRKASGD
jgi:arsenite-transporting ATPase